MTKYIIKEDQIGPRPTKYSIRYKEVLNPGQYAAATSLEGPLLVIAGAGSGKTRTLTYRVARLVEEGVPPSSILLLTFTRKTSMEMLRRASALLDHRCERVAGGTFHSFANTVLKKYRSRIGFESNFTIVDRADAEDVINLVRSRLNFNVEGRRFARKDTIATIYSKAANKEMSIEDVILEDYPSFISDAFDLIKLHKAYIAYKREHSLMDYDDLLIYLRELMRNHPDVRNTLSENFRFIMVDEYQDTNRIQADIVQLLAAAHDNVMVVGDDSQCIYSFRGANFGNIMDFPTIFPFAKIIKLEENYRSTQPILDVTNLIIARAHHKYTKTLFSQRKEGQRPAIVASSNEHMQSRFVSQRILELWESGTPLNEIAVLFRSSFHSYDLEVELARKNIPFIKVGGFRFSETAHVKDLLAHMKALANPLDAVSWHRLLRLIEGIGPKAADDIFREISVSGMGAAAIANINPRPRWKAGFKRLQDLLANPEIASLSVSGIGARVVEYYAPMMVHKFDDHTKRARDLDHLLSIMDRYSSLELFVSDMMLEPPNSTVNNTLASSQDGEHLVLSTVHSAKGLEWHTVFVIWALDGRFPSFYAMRSTEELEEELRLMYVAASRAKENLYFAYPVNVFDRASQMVLTRPSRFLDGIPQERLEQWSLGVDDWEPDFDTGYEVDSEFW